MKISFRPLEEKDLPMLYDWLMMPHVREWYNKRKKTYEEVYSKYLKRINKEEPTSSYVFQIDGVDAGYIQEYFYFDYPDYNNIMQADDSVMGIDYYIGNENFLHKGYGKLVVSKFLEEIVFKNPRCESCIISPNPKNIASLKLCESNGFKWTGRIIEDDDGDGRVMSLDKKDFVPLI